MSCSDLGPEEKKLVMNAERQFLSELLSASLGGEGKKVQKLTEEYCKKHEEDRLSPKDVLRQFKDGHRRTALHLACQSPPVDGNKSEDDIVYQLLLSSWAQSHCILGDNCKDKPAAIVRAKDRDGLTPLMLAASSCKGNSVVSLERIQTLLKAGGHKIALARSKAGASALHYAASAGANKDILHELHEAAKVAINYPSKKGGMPLHWAAAGQHGQPTPVQYDANENTGDSINQKEDTNYVETIQVLLDCHADINAKDEQGLTPLVVAIAARKDQIAAFLVRRGADRSLVLPGNDTVYHIAADLNLIRTLEELLAQDQGNNDETNLSLKMCAMKNDQGETPLDLATKEQNHKCVQLLTSFQKSPRKEDDHINPRNESAVAMDQDDREPVHNVTIKNNRGRSNDAVDAIKDGPDKDTIAIEKNAIREAEALLSATEHSTTSTSPNGTSAATTTTIVTEEDANHAEEQALRHKADGNKLYQRKQFADAIDEYTRAIHVLSQNLPTSSDQKKRKDDMISTISVLYSNRSACHSRLDQFDRALSDATVSRHLRPQWTKARYRVAVAQLGLQRYEEAAVAAWEGVQLDDELQQHHPKGNSTTGEGKTMDVTKKPKTTVATSFSDYESEELKTLLRQAVDLGKKAHQHSLLMKKKKKEENKEDEAATEMQVDIR